MLDNEYYTPPPPGGSHQVWESHTTQSIICQISALNPKKTCEFGKLLSGEKIASLTARIPVRHDLPLALHEDHTTGPRDGQGGVRVRMRSVFLQWHVRVGGCVSVSYTGFARQLTRETAACFSLGCCLVLMSTQMRSDFLLKVGWEHECGRGPGCGRGPLV